jgi:DNA/RNA-binding domain of Phe-tRNA-synthetase-like protein
MNFRISKEILREYPKLEVGIIVVKNADNSGYHPNIKTLICEEEDKWKDKNIESEKIKEIPVIARWRGIYKDFGAKPKDYKNSAESILKLALNKGLPTINPLVDLYNYISLKYTLTAGGEDIDKMEGDLVLDFAKGDEEFIPLGKKENEPPWKGEIVYKDDKGGICRCWNWKEGDRTKLTENTKNAVIVIENIIPEDNKKLRNALNELKELIKKYCVSECEIQILNKENWEIKLK